MEDESVNPVIMADLRRKKHVDQDDWSSLAANAYEGAKTYATESIPQHDLLVARCCDGIQCWQFCFRCSWLELFLSKDAFRW